MSAALVARAAALAGNAAVARRLGDGRGDGRSDGRGDGLASVGTPDFGSFTETVAGSGSGSALPEAFRDRAEDRFGVGLAGVRVHSDPAAQVAASAISADAFTIGSDVYFARDQYQPDTRAGQRLLAHEVTHVVQGGAEARGAGSWLSSPSDPAEVEAEAVADEWDQHHEGAQSSDTGPSLAGSAPDAPPGSVARSADAGSAVVHRDPAPPDAPAPNPPQHGSQTIATWIGWIDTSVKTTVQLGAAPLADYAGMPGMIPASVQPAGWTGGSYQSEDAAVAAIKAAGTAGAVFDETGQFVAYHVDGAGIIHDFTFDNVRWFRDKPWTAVRFDNGANLIVTQDGVVLRPENFKSEDDAKAASADQALMPGAGTGDPFAAYRQALGDPNKSAAVLSQMFAPAMRDNALARLASAIPLVERDIERRSSSGLIPPSEVALMRSTAEYLAGIDQEMDDVPKSLPPDPEAYDRFWALHARRQVVVRRYPVLARVDPRQFVKLSPDEQMAQLGAKSLQIRKDIDTARDSVLDGSLNLWKIQSLVDSTIAGLGITDPNARAYVRRLADANQSSVAEDLLTVFTVVFGLLSMVVDGPVGAVIAAGALGLSTADAINQTEQITAENAAANTALDPAASLLPPEEARGWAWLVVAWLGVVADAAQVVAAVRAVKAAGGTIEEGVRVLARADEALSRELRLAAGALDATEVVSEANKIGLARRVGTSIEIDAELGKDVRVVYHVDSEGRAVVDGIRCGPEATAGVILAHEGVVAELRRYDGVLGKIRELIDKVRSLAGFPAAGVNPFPAGSQAFESFYELEKLPEVIASRQAALGASLGTESEDALRREVEYLQSEMVRHEAVVDQMVAEQGAGFIAASGESTTKAISEGMPALAGNPLVSDPAKYYYRANPGGQPPYILQRMANADVPALTLVQEGGGWKIATGALSRTEAAEAMVAGFSPKAQEAFEAVKSAYSGSGVFRVVPLQGVASTGRTFREILTQQQSEQMLNILTRAFTAAKQPEAEGKAFAAMEALLEHEVTVVRGTDQLRAYNYRLAFEKAAGAEAEGDLHHLIPLYMGGGHDSLVDLPLELHNQLHDLIDTVRLEEGVTLAPSSIQRAATLNFSEGAAVLKTDRTVQLVRLNADGTFTLVP